jgi:hypothetical protein
VKETLVYDECIFDAVLQRFSWKIKWKNPISDRPRQNWMEKSKIRLAKTNLDRRSPISHRPRQIWIEKSNIRLAKTNLDKKVENPMSL